MKSIAIIPCRSGSKRIPRKNLQEIEPGISLVRCAVDCAERAGVFHRIIVVTDDRSYLPPLPGADIWLCPPELCTDTADIAGVSQWCVERCSDVSLVTTLQPAVIARSPTIVRDLVLAVALNTTANGGLTMAAAHPWTWTDGVDGLAPRWAGAPGYPRSQNLPRTLCEINAVQVARADTVRRGLRWEWPLSILELPNWSQALDIDTPSDLEQARAIWPIAHPLLSAWRGKISTHEGPR